MATLSPAAASCIGFSSMLALVSIPGAQNALLLEESGRPIRALRCAVIFCFADMLLIAAGAGLFSGGSVLAPISGRAALFAGVVFLSHLGLSAIGSAIGGSPVPLITRPASVRNDGEIVFRSFAVTFCNPLVYIDTIGVIGSLAALYPEQRTMVAAGACAASVAWFSGLLALGRVMHRSLRLPSVQKAIRAAGGGFMLYAAWSLFTL